MNRRDRYASLALFALAALSWVAAGYVLTTFYPEDSPATFIAGAFLLGTALALTLAPVLWMASFIWSRHIAYRGSWWRAARRAAIVGFVVAMFVLMRGQDAFSVPLALFVVAMALLVELTISRRG